MKTKRNYLKSILLTTAAIATILFTWSCTTFTCGDNVTFTYQGETVTYGTVEGQNGTIWMDRNLGASRVAQSFDDELAYGDLFQWGRGDDGHQLRTSETTAKYSKTDDPGHGNFITTSLVHDWRDPENDNLWQGDGSINDVCPAGWRVPTETELENELLSWSSDDREGAFASPLKFVAGGSRSVYGALPYVGSFGYYWSSSLIASQARYLLFSCSHAVVSKYPRGSGKSVRCIRDD